MSDSIQSILFGSANPDRTRQWYADAFGVRADSDGFVGFGSVGVLFDQRDEVATRTVEPGRIILNHHVPDIRAAGRRIDEMGATWVSPVEYRDAGLWFGTVEDPDGNYVQLIEITPEYWSRKRQRSGGTSGPLDGASLGVRLPAKDLDRARTFYAERLGLEPIDERDGALLYSCGGQEFAVFVSAGAANGNHTQLGFIVANLDDVVAELRGRGVVFEEFDFGDFPVTDGIVEITGYYPSKAPTGERAIWFRDSEGNLLAVGEVTYR